MSNLILSSGVIANSISICSSSCISSKQLVIFNFYYLSFALVVLSSITRKGEVKN